MVLHHLLRHILHFGFRAYIPGKRFDSIAMDKICQGRCLEMHGCLFSGNCSATGRLSSHAAFCIEVRGGLPVEFCIQRHRGLLVGYAAY